jgi:hypothetical protein
VKCLYVCVCVCVCVYANRIRSLEPARVQRVRLACVFLFHTWVVLPGLLTTAQGLARQPDQHHRQRGVYRTDSAH